MRVDAAEMWTPLRSLDDPYHLEFPAGYDHAETRARFEELVRRLNIEFSCQCLAGRNVEDASLHARVDVPAAATDTGENLVICVSNFGGLATVAVTNPGSWSQPEFEELLAPGDADRIFGGTVALSVDIITAQEIFRLAVAPSAQVAVPSD